MMYGSNLILFLQHQAMLLVEPTSTHKELVKGGGLITKKQGSGKTRLTYKMELKPHLWLSFSTAGLLTNFNQFRVRSP